MATRSGRKITRAVTDPGTEWTRRKLQALVAASVVVVLLLCAGGVWTIVAMLDGPTTPALGDDRSTTGSSAEDRLAADRLPGANLDAAQPGTPLSSGQTGVLPVPAPTAVGAAGVATGFPRTPAGALAQLAAIDTAALTSASVRGAQDVITAWAAPAGPTAQNWSGVTAVAALLQSAGLSSDGKGAITIGADPQMGFIKGTVGGDFVIPCLDLVLTATLIGTTTDTLTGSAAGSMSGAVGLGGAPQVAAADCQRMIWQNPDPEPVSQPTVDPAHPSSVDPTGSTADSSVSRAGGRWVIGPGAEPARAPSLWPGSQASFDAGYQWLEIPQ